MDKPQVVNTLEAKRADIESAIAAYEKKIEAAKRDLSAVNATIRLFEVAGERQEFPAYMDLSRLWKRGEMFGVCKAALAKEGPLDTRELAARVIAAKGLDAGDTVLRQSVTYRIVQMMTMNAKRGAVGTSGKRKGVRVWCQPNSVQLTKIS